MKFKKSLVLICAICSLITNWNSTANAQNEKSTSSINQSKEKMNNTTVYEIAIRQIKNNLEAFEKARTDFIHIWLSSEGVSGDREFKAFYNIPQNNQPVFVGMTEWDSQEAFYAASNQHGNSEKAKAFFSQFDMLAFATLKPTEGDFELATLGKDNGTIVEMAIRRVSTEKRTAFNTSRKRYIEALNAVPGVKGSFEFEVVMSGSGDNLTVGMTVYEDKAAFDNTNETVNQSQIAKDYFSTFEISTIQYVNSVK
ncbi:MAG: hypothetical protein AAGA77_10440 [Bacteroidota bacterium]